MEYFGLVGPPMTNDRVLLTIRTRCLAVSEDRPSKLLSTSHKVSDPSLTSAPFWKEKQ
jgi:hypothetical protein